MSTRTCKKKSRHGDNQNEENSTHCSSVRLDKETNSLTGEQVDKISLRIQNQLT